MGTLLVLRNPLNETELSEPEQGMDGSVTSLGSCSPGNFLPSQGLGTPPGDSSGSSGFIASWVWVGVAWLEKP